MSKSIDEQATDWLLRLNEADAKAEDFDAFEQWCARDRGHREAYDRVSGLWSGLDALEPAIAGSPPDNVTIFPAGHAAHEHPVPARRGRWSAAWSGAIAAGLACLIVFSALTNASYFADYSTATGEQSRIRLEDGSVGYLNTDTAIDVSFGPLGRRIELLKGEAYFDVRKDPERPFEVIAQGGRSVALGTSYAVRTDHRAGTTTVTVAEGRVGVRAGDNAGASPPVVAAGQQIRYSGDGTVGPVRDIDIADALAWKRGFISFQGLSLDEAVAEIDRYVPGLILLLADETRTTAVSATLSLKSLDDGLAALASTHHLSVRRISPYLTLIY